MNTRLLLNLFIFLSLVPLTVCTQPQEKLKDKSVRFIYLVSKDRKINPAYKNAIEMAAKNIQAWYKKQIDATFQLNDVIVEVVKSDKNAAYFYDNPNGKKKDQWGYNNTLDECKRLLNVKNNDARYVYVIYSDGPGNSGMGGGGVCIMPEDDLLGLIGKHPTQPEINRWIAGLGHEVGHAFGLNHPKDTQKDADAIMWTGIYGGKYPDVCYLTEEDKGILLESPFFFYENGEPVRGEAETLETFNYKGGTFTRFRNTKTKRITWTETTAEQSQFDFKETKKDTQFYYLKSINRNIEIKIPLDGGKSFLSTDGGKTWGFFQTMDKE